MHSQSPLPKVALVYDWIDTQYGGAEKVLAALHRAFPEAVLFTSVAQSHAISWIKDLSIKTSFLQRLPRLGTKPRYLVPLLPIAFETLDLSEFDIIISVTSGPAKGVLTKPHQLHLCYILTPPRYLYSHQTEYLAQSSPLATARYVISKLFSYLRWWDQVAAYRPDQLIAISELIAHRCQSTYHLSPSRVIYPPVDKLITTQKPPVKLPDTFMLVVSRLVAYKRIDLAILACQQLELPLVIIGDGEERAHLEALVTNPSNVHFLGHQPQAVVNYAVSKCQAVLMPGIEDFGITAAEAIASGRPAIVHAQSGVAELINHRKNGLLISELSTESLVAALEQVPRISFKSELLQKSMRKYATTTFVQTMRKVVGEAWQSMQDER